MFALTWATLLPASLMEAHVGVLLWVWTALLSPTDVLIGFMSGLPLNKAIAGITFLRMLVSRERLDRYADPLLKLLIALAATATISWFNAIVSSGDITELYLKLIKAIVLAFVIAYVMTTRARLHLLVLVIVVALGFNAVKEGMIFLLTAGGHQVLGSGSIGDNNSLATALLMIIPLTAYLIRRSAVRLVRIALIGTLILCLVTVVATYSRGGFVGLLVLGAFMVKNSKHKFASIGLVLAVIVTVYVSAPASWFQRLSTIEVADQDNSFMYRVVAWKMSLLIALDHPLFGGGPHAVQQLAVWTNYRPSLPSVDFVTTPTALDRPIAAHSIYFEMLGDYGFLGVALFLAGLGATVWNLSKIQRMAKGHPSVEWAADLARMVQISFAVYLTTGAALSMGYFELVYILIALTSRCRRTVFQLLAEENAALAASRVAPLKSQRLAVPQPAFAFDMPFADAAERARPQPRHPR